MHVLVIENDQPRLRLMAWLLREEGFEVAAATTAEAAQRARDLAPVVIVFNTSEPEDEKRACIEQLRAASPGTGIIDLTVEAAPGGSGADAYLGANAPVSEIRAAIERLAPP